MKPMFIALTVLVLSILVAGPVLAQPTMEECPHPMAATIPSLQTCVQHAASMGIIDTAGVANSLLVKLDAAQNALNRGQVSVAVNLLQAFVDEVNAQAGVHVDPQHAAHMVAHAQMVIDALGG